MYNRIYLIWVALPLLPFIMGFAVLELLNDGTIDLLTRSLNPESFFPNDRDLRFFNGFIVYSVVGLFHIIICIAVIGAMSAKLWAMDSNTKRQSLLVLGLIIALLIFVNVMARDEAFLGALNITYRSTCAILVESGVAPHILPKGCDDEGLSTLAWFAVMPYLFGILAAAFTSAVISTAHSNLNAKEHAGLIDLSFQATAFVLVTSTISLMLFYRLPLTVVEDETARVLVSEYAQGMALFWGIVFTLTLLTIFGPSNLMLIRALASQPNLENELREKVAERSTKQQLSKILTMLAPLLVGSSASIIDMITKSL